MAAARADPDPRTTGSSSRCSPAPDCAPASCATSPPTPSSSIGDDPLAARPRRQAAQRPLHPAAPRPRRACSPTGPHATPTTSDPAPTDRRPPATPRPAPRRTASSPRRHARRHRPRPPPPAPPHPGHPSHQPRACASKRSPPCSDTARCEMTLTYARIADRVVADEYASVSAQIDALYSQTTPAPCPPTSRPPR